MHFIPDGVSPTVLVLIQWSTKLEHERCQDCKKGRGTEQEQWTISIHHGCAASHKWNLLPACIIPHDSEEDGSCESGEGQDHSNEEDAPPGTHVRVQPGIRGGGVDGPSGCSQDDGESKGDEEEGDEVVPGEEVGCSIKNVKGIKEDPPGYTKQDTRNGGHDGTKNGWLVIIHVES